MKVEGGRPCRMMVVVGPSAMLRAQEKPKTSVMLQRIPDVRKMPNLPLRCMILLSLARRGNFGNVVSPNDDAESKLLTW